MSYVTFELKEEVIGLVTINRPEALNAINRQVLMDLKKAIEEAENSAVKCLIVTGAGEKAFAAGADIGEMAQMTQAEAKEYSLMAGEVFARLESFKTPVIAGVSGYALGGGCELSLVCDIRIASDTAVFALPEVSLGIIPGWGGMQRLARAVGQSKARQMIFTGARIKALEAKEAGLVSDLCPASELLQKCKDLALAIARNSSGAVGAAKEALNEGVSRGLTDAAQMESTYFGSCFEKEDQIKAMNAFLEKRKS